MIYMSVCVYSQGPKLWAFCEIGETVWGRVHGVNRMDDPVRHTDTHTASNGYLILLFVID